MWLRILFLYVVFWSTIGKLQKSTKNYDGYKVYNLSLDTVDKIEFIKNYEGVKDYNFWLLPTRGYAHLMVAPYLQPRFEKEMEYNNINYNILNENVGKSIIQEQKHRARNKATARSFNNVNLLSTYNFNYFPRYNEIVDFMKLLVRNKKYSKIINIGNSFEGKPIYGVEVKKSLDNPVFLIDAGIHAREWASHVAALYIAKKVVENEEKFSDKMSFVIIPCVNPDGYEFTHTIDRFWRKTRSVHKSSNCRGVDLNRNFDSHWGEFKAEKKPCADSFRGAQPFSEPESRALRDIILKYQPTVYLTLHSFGSLILYPWGFTKHLPSNWKTLHDLAVQVAQRIKQINGTNYDIGSSANVLYEASGGSDDWAMEKATVPIVFTMELPEYDKGMFIVPKKKIKPLVHETYQAFLVLVDNIYQKCHDQ